MAPTYGPVINGPPDTSTTAGIPFGLSFAGRPAAYPVFTPLPVEITRRFGKYSHTASSLVFDFGAAATYDRCGYMKGEGIVLAAGAAGGAQASMKFTYKWSRFPQCKPVDTPSFTIDACTTKGLVFVVLDDVSYLSTDPCTESIIVLNCQQYCVTPDSTPSTLVTCCTGTGSAGCCGRTCDLPLDAVYEQPRSGCVAAPMPPVYINSILKQDGVQQV